MWRISAVQLRQLRVLVVLVVCVPVVEARIEIGLPVCEAQADPLGVAVIEAEVVAVVVLALQGRGAVEAVGGVVGQQVAVVAAVGQDRGFRRILDL